MPDRRNEEGVVAVEARENRAPGVEVPMPSLLFALSQVKFESALKEPDVLNWTLPVFPPGEVAVRQVPPAV